MNANVRNVIGRRRDGRSVTIGMKGTAVVNGTGMRGMEGRGSGGGGEMWVNIA